MTALAPHPFTLRQLQYAVAIADSLSFRKAGECCRVSQPSLSAQLPQLESAVGVRLFERDRRRVLITEPGRAFLERARRLLLEADDLVEEAKRAADPFEGTLRIGVIPTISPYLLPHSTPAIHADYPRLTVLWTEDKTDAIIARLEAGSLDAVLLALEAKLGDLEHAEIARDRFVLVAPSGHPLMARKAPALASELRGEDVLLLDEGHCFREQALAFCASAKARELEFRATSLSTLAQMVASGAGITLLPELALETELARTRLTTRPVAEPAPSRTIALGWRRRSPLGPALRRLAKTIQSAYPKSKRQRRT